MVKVIKEKFVVIGKEGSTLDGEGFIQAVGRRLSQRLVSGRSGMC